VRNCGESTSFPWFALQVRSRHENIVAAFLRGKEYEWFLPTYRCRRRWSDRTKDLELPLFPGYLFCRFHPTHRLPILKIPGLVSIVGTAKKPVPIDDVEIAAVRTLVGSGLPRQPWPYVRVGQKVRIEWGALCGLEGILQSFKGRHQIVLSVSLLQRSVATEIDSAWMTPVHPCLPPSTGRGAAQVIATRTSFRENVRLQPSSQPTGNEWAPVPPH
jgi:transcription termination/antitermination protein NusG